MIYAHYIDFVFEKAEVFHWRFWHNVRVTYICKLQCDFIPLYPVEVDLFSQNIRTFNFCGRILIPVWYYKAIYFNTSNILKTYCYADTEYNIKIRYNDNSTVTKPSLMR